MDNQNKRFPRPYTNVISFNAICRCCGGNLFAGELVHKYLFGNAKPVFTHIPENCTNRNSKWIARDEWWGRTQKVIEASKADTATPLFTPIGRFNLPKSIYQFKLEGQLDQPLNPPLDPPPVVEQQAPQEAGPVAVPEQTEAVTTKEFTQLTNSEIEEALQIQGS
jgi:hypothetical protein